MQKVVIRKSLMDRRLSLPEVEVRSKSLLIQRKFLASAIYRGASTLALYSSFRGEVRTDLVIRSAISKGKKVLLPKICRDDFSMEFITISVEGDLVDAGEGFMEPDPDKGKAYEPEKIDLFVVPGVAYDLRGNRLGMGKGFYDRALSVVDRRRIVALAYEFQIVEDLPSYRHDIGVGLVITEDRMVNTL